MVSRFSVGVRVVSVALAWGMFASLASVEAGAGGGREARPLGAPVTSERVDADGEVSAKESRRIRSLRIRVSGLEARHRYRVVADDESAGEFRTNGRGRATVRLKDRARRSGRAVREMADANGHRWTDDSTDTRTDTNTVDGRPDDGKPRDNLPVDDDFDWADGDWQCVRILDAETDDCVLACDGDEHGGDDGWWGDRPVDVIASAGFAEVSGDRGLTGFISLFHMSFDGQTWDDFSFSMTRLTDDWTKGEGWDYWGNSLDGLPLGVDTVTVLAGRAYEVRDFDGNVLLSGDLPRMEDVGGIFYDPMDGDVPSDRGNGPAKFAADGDVGPNGVPGYLGPPDRAPSESDLFLFIADESGDLAEAGVLFSWTWEWNDDPWICPDSETDRPCDSWPGDGDGTDGSGGDGNVGSDGSDGSGNDLPQR